MVERRIQRRLAAILAVDVVGYSRMMEADEAGTLGRLKALRADFLHPKVAEFGGRVVKTTGDGTLIEFPSAVDAVQHAVEVQREMARLAAPDPEDRRIRLRMGINLGDVLIDGDDIYGDGVNVAARLEALAEPGSIFVSGTVREHVQGKLDVTFEDMGERTVKNIARPVHVYSILADNPTPNVPGAKPAFASSAERAPSFSIVVLPFANMSGDPGQDYLGDVLTEDLTTYLSRIPDGFVIARSTAFTYKGKPVNATQVGKELGVRYVLEGSVQPSRHRVRVNAQLIDAETGGHLWAERFDAERAELLDMQDEIVTRIARTLQIQLTAVAAARLARVQSENHDLETLALRAEALFLTYGISRRAEADECLRLCEDVLQKDPRNVRALGIVGLTLAINIVLRLSENPRADISRAEELSNRALAVDPKSSLAHHAKAAVLQAQGRLAEAIVEDENALEFNPVYIGTYVSLSHACMVSGQPERTIEYVDRAIRLSPRDPILFALLARRGQALFMQQRDAPAIESFRKSLTLQENQPDVHLHLVSALALDGQEKEARALLERYIPRAQAGNKTISHLKRKEISDNAVYRAYCERLYEGLRRAGMPE